ncbi:FAD-dependent thymidylate synthase [Anaerosinus massiliensis]|uniref:FAD-dependent thymidylate synthase n=1 Tax=Massilibacillus massiliensis TaxID=1806837 RepID=UPI000B339FE8|nr:FAD-dependent thymidylate synthase [Massilibacillus massiliensis]
MKIAQFEATGIDKVEHFFELNDINSLSERELCCFLKACNISFILEGINRIQSTLICELKDSYVQQSQRYVTLNLESYLLPSLEENDEKKAQELTMEAFALYTNMSRLKDGEFKGRPKRTNYLYGIPIEDARYILPLGTKTNVCVAMAGDKLVQLFQLLTNPQYGELFTTILDQFKLYLPKRMFQLLMQQTIYTDKTLMDNFYQMYFDRIDAAENLILLDQFSELDMKVGFGAMTSTMKITPSEAIAKWGEEAPTKAKGVVKRVLSYGHTSIAEQARTTFGMMCSLVTYHQQLRHRITTNYRENLNVVLHDQQREVIIPETIRESNFCEEYKRLVERFRSFRKMVAEKYGTDKALPFLLNCDQIKLIISANARADISMLADRTCMNAQWEIRELAVKKVMILRKLSPELYEKALPSCVLGSCREGKMTCGQAGKMREKFLNLEQIK